MTPWPVNTRILKCTFFIFHHKKKDWLLPAMLLIWLSPLWQINASPFYLFLFRNFLFSLIIHSFYIFHLTVSISLLIIFCYLTNPVYYCLLINSQVIILCWIQFHSSRIKINFLNWPALQHGCFSTLMKWIKMLDASSHITLRILVLLLATEIR